MYDPNDRESERKMLHEELMYTATVTWLPPKTVSKLLENHSHSEIRQGKMVDGKFVPKDIYIADYLEEKDLLLKHNRVICKS